MNGRCRMHGGLSTGAKTQEGKDKSREAARRGMLAYWAKKR
ncbi:MAG: HGGxSTG domain-containing protein [Chlamydiia bacterium]